jgi:hypothetical protein
VNSYRLPAWIVTGPQAPPPVEPSVIAIEWTGAAVLRVPSAFSGHTWTVAPMSPEF